MHKIIKEIFDVKKELFVDIQESLNGGHNFKLRKSKATKLPRINAFSNRVLDKWNRLPANVVKAKNQIIQGGNRQALEIDKQHVRKSF